MKVSAIVVAAGRGIRLGSAVPKPLVRIHSCPLLVYSLKVLSAHPRIHTIIVVAHPETVARITKLVSRFHIRKVRAIVEGGRRRQDSVYNGLTHAEGDFVLIHDAARPCIDARNISAVITGAFKSGAAIAGVPVKATIKESQGPLSTGHGKFMVKRTLDRSRLWEIQTPQVFRKDMLMKAYKKFGQKDATDDAMLVEKLGVRVSLVPGSYRNIKVTTAEDLAIAGVLLRNRE